jgi:hypothetical protein
MSLENRLNKIEPMIEETDLKRWQAFGQAFEKAKPLHSSLYREIDPYDIKAALLGIIVKPLESILKQYKDVGSLNADRVNQALEALECGLQPEDIAPARFTNLELQTLAAVAKVYEKASDGYSNLLLRDLLWNHGQCFRVAVKIAVEYNLLRDELEKA